MSKAPTLQERRQAVFRRATTATLVESLTKLEAQVTKDRAEGTPDDGHRLARAWTIDELESRFPQAAQAVGAACEAAEVKLLETGQDVEVDYVAVLLDHVLAAQAAALA